jgi:hypothetical protein
MAEEGRESPFMSGTDRGRGGAALAYMEGGERTSAASSTKACFADLSVI